MVAPYSFHNTYTQATQSRYSVARCSTSYKSSYSSGENVASQ